MNKLIILSLLLLLGSYQAFASTKIVEITTPSGYASESDTESGLTLLRLSSLFYGTDHYTREEIEEILHQIGTDVSPLSHVRVGPTKSSIRFYVSEENLPILFPLVEEMIHTKNINPMHMEMAREAILYNAKNREEGENENVIQQLSSLTSSQVANVQEEMILTISEDEKLIALAAPSTNLSQTVKISDKIYMKEPSVTQKRFEGRLIGIVCLSVSVGIAVTASSIFSPITLLFSLATLGTGFYFTIENYYSDPIVIEEKRVEDLAKGFTHSYKAGRAIYTLTPFERRNSFLAENTIKGNPHEDKLANYPIAKLADTYNLFDPVMRQMFYMEELNFMKTIKDDFVLQRNQYYRAKSSLEEDLNTLLIPYLAQKNIQLDQTRRAYETDPHITTMRSLKKQWEGELKTVHENYLSSVIDLETRDSNLQQINAFYEEALNKPNLAEGIQLAKDILDYDQKRAISTYDSKVNDCKTIINYEARIAQIEAGVAPLYSYHDELLRNYLINLPMNDSNFEDFIDRRRVF